MSIVDRFNKRKALDFPGEEESPEQVPEKESIPVPGEYSMDAWVFRMNEPISYLWNMFNIDLSGDPEWSQLGLDSNQLKTAIATLVEIYQRAESQVMGGWDE